jgi:exodeoxyribonuclease VII small subunit
VDTNKPKSGRSKPSPSEESELGFEAALEQVEAIIEQVESGQIGLEESIAQYERGAALILRCRKILDRAEQRVQDLTAQMTARAPGGDEPGDGEPRS